MQIFLKTQQYNKYRGFIKKILRNRVFFVKMYFLLKWVSMDLKKYLLLRKMQQDNPDFGRMKWFIEHYSIKRSPKKEKFIQ